MGKSITIGIAGHVDHGKTALVKCLTGIDTDRLKEEKLRGFSIETGIAPLTLQGDIQAALVDVPGHTDFLKNTIRGLNGVDLAVLVVAADDGVMPQTLEHLEILEYFGVKGGFVVISKADLVDNEILELAEVEIRDLIEGTFLAGRPVVPFSAFSLRGLEDIRKLIEEEAIRIPVKDNRDPFRLWIDQVKMFQGFGTIVSGTVHSGILKQDDPLVLLPSGRETAVRSIQSHHQRLTEVSAGQRAGLNIRKISLGEVKRGMALTEPGAMSAAYLLNGDLCMSRHAKRPLKNRQRIRLHLGTSITNSLVILMEGEQVEPEGRGLVQFRLLKPIAAQPGDNFVISLLNLPLVIGGGTILEIPGEKYRKAKAGKIIPCLKALQTRDLKGFLEGFFKNRPLRPITIEELSRKIHFSVSEIGKELKDMVKRGELLSLAGQGFFGKADYLGLKASLLDLVGSMLRKNPLKKDVKSDEIRARLSPDLDEGLFKGILAELCHEERLVKTKGGLQVPGNSGRLDSKQEELIDLIMEFAGKSSLSPFSADTIWKFHERRYEKKEIQRLLGYLKSLERLVMLNDKRFLSVSALEEIKARVHKVILEKGCFTIPDCKTALGYGRTVAIPILEYLDTIHFTRRQGDERFLMK